MRPRRENSCKRSAVCEPTLDTHHPSHLVLAVGKGRFYYPLFRRLISDRAKRGTSIALTRKPHYERRNS